MPNLPRRLQNPQRLAVRGSKRGIDLQRRYLLRAKNRGFYTSTTTVPLRDGIALSWSHSDLAELLDLTSLGADAPVVKTSGVYAVTVNLNAHVGSGVALPAGVSFQTVVSLDAAGLGGFQGVAREETFQVGTDEDAMASLHVTWYIPAGGQITVIVGNRDTSDQQFFADMFVQLNN